MSLESELARNTEELARHTDELIRNTKELIENTAVYKSLVDAIGKMDAPEEVFYQLKAPAEVEAPVEVKAPAEVEVVVEAPKPTTPTDVGTATISYAEVAAAIVATFKADRAKTIAALAQFGAKKGPELKEQDYAAFLGVLAS